VDRRAAARAALALTLAAASCRLPGLSPGPELPALWRPPAAAAEPERLRLVPVHAVARLGESVQLHVEGPLAASAHCVTGAGETEPPPLLEIASPERPGVVDVLCGAQGARASAQVTFTDAQTLPVSDPYAGGTALFKLRALRVPLGPVGTRAVGLAVLDAKLERLSAWALAAFPFADPAADDAAGIARWIAVDVPAGVNYYQAIDWIRRDPAVETASWLPVDSQWLAVEARAQWPARFAPIAAAPADGALVRPVSNAVPAPDPAFATRDLRSVGAPDVWSTITGRGVRIAIVDTGLDVNHAALAPNLMFKPRERPGADTDGNGVPGDASGANFAHLALVRGAGPPELALGLQSDVSDWHGALEGARDWGHGTAIASLAAGAGGPGARLGVAPRAELVAVDVEENLRIAQSSLLAGDPRLREREAGGPPLRSSTWARAAGIVYAVNARARVLTCAWSDDAPHALLHDALAYAEDNCALPVCAVEEPPGPLDSFPAQWRGGWLARRGERSGRALDLWTGELLAEFFARPLDATLLAGALEARGEPTPEADEVAPDLFAPTGGWRGRGGVAAAASNPRDDQTPGPDYRATAFHGPAAAAGLIAGAAALISELRPDLEPAAVAAALRSGARDASGRPLLQVGGALRAAQKQPPGQCRAPLARTRTTRIASQPWWKRVRWEATPGRADDSPPPASAEHRDPVLEQELSSSSAPSW
jgi:subtilisin family serine protease